MKHLGFFILAFLSVLGVSLAQESQPAPPATNSVEQIQVVEQPGKAPPQRPLPLMFRTTTATNQVQPQIRQPVSYQGVLPQLRRAPNPFQLINPFARTNYGSAYQNVVFNPHTGRAEGISFLTIGY